MIWLLALISAASPRYVMSVGGLPVGVVSFSVEGDVYTYRSMQVFRSKTQEITERLTVSERPEVWWLSRKRPDGCVITTEERTHQSEEVCTREGGGTIARRPFTSHYDANGALNWLELSGVRFEASSAELPSRVDPFAEGFEVTGDGARVQLQPQSKGVESVRVASLATEDEGSCLDVARAYVAKNRNTTVVLGVVIDEGRAWPHAWVKTAKGMHLDPTGPPKPRQYLAFPSSDAGRLYLELLAQKRLLISD